LNFLFTIFSFKDRPHSLCLLCALRGESFLTKPNEIKDHEKGQAGHANQKEEPPEPIVLQERMKTQITRSDLKSNEDNDSAAKEEWIFQDQWDLPALPG
jgi:hypothetical protein